MAENITLSIGIAFVALGVVFVAIAFQDYLKEKGKLTIARNIWLRMAFIFSSIGIGLAFLNIFM